MLYCAILCDSTDLFISANMLVLSMLLGSASGKLQKYSAWLYARRCVDCIPIWNHGDLTQSARSFPLPSCAGMMG